MTGVAASDDLVDAIVGHLQRNGLVVEPTGTDTFRVRSAGPGAFAHEPEVRLPGRWVRAWVEEQAASLRKYPDPAAEALSLARLNVLEALTTDHDGRGTNHARVVAFGRGRDGRAELAVEQDPPGPEPLDPGDGPYEWRAERP